MYFLYANHTRTKRNSYSDVRAWTYKDRWHQTKGVDGLKKERQSKINMAMYTNAEGKTFNRVEDCNYARFCIWEMHDEQRTLRLRLSSNWCSATVHCSFPFQQDKEQSSCKPADHDQSGRWVSNQNVNNNL